MMLIIVLAYACADSRWRKEGASEEQWQRDTVACRIKAAEQVRRENRRDEQSRDGGGFGPGYYGRSAAGNAATFDRSMSVFSSNKRRTELAARCLTGRGYRRVEADEE